MITFIGGIIPAEDYDWYMTISKSAVPVSSDTHQKSIIEGIRKYEETDVLFIAPCGIFPTRCKTPFIAEREYNSRLRRIKSSTIPLFRSIYNKKTQIEALRESIKKGSSSIVCYMPFATRMKAIFEIKKEFPNVIVIAVIPDLVEHSYSTRGSYIRKKIAKKMREHESLIVNKLATCVDGFVLLTEMMKDRIGIDKPYIVQEAIYNIQDNEVAADEGLFPDDSFVFTYCGKLTKVNGVDRLINAFLSISNPKAILCLCGDGELLEYAKEIAIKDTRIIVTGQVPHDKVKGIEKRSSVLVNPRYSNIKNAAYSFPSKLIEYMACGRPVISSHLSGIPSEYDPYVFYVKDDSVESLKETMMYTLSLDNTTLSKIGRDNEKFVSMNKSSEAQGEKLVKFIDNLRRRQLR